MYFPDACTHDPCRYKENHHIHSKTNIERCVEKEKEKERVEEREGEREGKERERWTSIEIER